MVSCVTCDDTNVYGGALGYMTSCDMRASRLNGRSRAEECARIDNILVGVLDFGKTKTDAFFALITGRTGLMASEANKQREDITKTIKIIGKGLVTLN